MNAAQSLELCLQGTIRLENLSKLEVERMLLHVQSRRTRNAKFEIIGIYL